jgi:hypothetical protein
VEFFNEDNLATGRYRIILCKGYKLKKLNLKNMAKENELEIGQKWTLKNPTAFNVTKDSFVEIVSFYRGDKNNITVKTENGKTYNGLYPNDLKEKIILNKQGFEKLLEEKEREFNEEVNSIKAKIQFLEETRF